MQGTFGGATFTPMDAIAYVDQAKKSAEIVLTSTPNACADVQENVERQNAQVLLILVTDATAGDTSLALGAYATSYSDPMPARWSIFESNKTDANCQVTYDPPPDGTGDGSVTVSSMIGTTLVGSFDMRMESGEQVTGTFAPTSCPALATKSGTPTCMP